jgi:hypothetical protein
MRHLGQPQLQALVGRVGREQAVQRGGPGPGEPGDEDRPLDADPGVSGVASPRRLAEQPGHQRAAQEGPEHLGAQFGQAGLTGAGVQQHGEAVPVVIGAEVRQPGDPGGRRMQVPGGTDAVTFAHGAAQWWYSPPSTPRHWPVMARAIGEARNTTASATSSGSGSLRRSIVAAVSS